MNFTNNKKLPKAIENFAKASEKEIVDKEYSATTIIGPTREILLRRRHDHQITMDVSEKIWAIFGSAVHKIIESYDQTGNSELSLRFEIKDGYTLTGRTDLFDEENMILEDYKTVSTWKVINQDFEDWKKQGLIYAYLLRKQHKLVDTLRFHAMLKDWSRSDKNRAEFKGDFYPDSPWYVWEYKVTTDDILFIEEFIKERFDEIILSENLSDEELPECTPSQRWNQGDKYVIKKEGQKKAVKICSSLEEANEYIGDKKLTIEIRKGEDKKCKEFCSANLFCNYYQEHVKEEI